VVTNELVKGIDPARAQCHRSSWLSGWPRNLVVVLLMLLATPATGCDRADDNTKETPKQLPPLELSDKTPDLLLTWIDQKGDTHTVVHIDKVPASGRSQVRIITKTAGHGAMFYVADLSRKQANGRYAVTTMSRAAWDGIIEKRRAAYRANHAPPANSQQPQQPGASGLAAIVYGAAWCKPCHQAADFLKKRGVRVVEYDIDKKRAHAREMRQKLRRSGQMGGSIPVIDLNGQIFVGYNPRVLDRAVRKLSSRGTKL